MASFGRPALLQERRGARQWVQEDGEATSSNNVDNYGLFAGVTETGWRHPTIPAHSLTLVHGSLRVAPID